MRTAHLLSITLFLCALPACKDSTIDYDVDDNEHTTDCSAIDDEVTRLACTDGNWLDCLESETPEDVEACQESTVKNWQDCYNLKDKEQKKTCSEARDARWENCETIATNEEQALCERSKELQGECSTLFGLPNENSGLTDEQCQPIINLPDLHWEEPIYSNDYVEELENAVLLTDMREKFYNITENPYPNQDDYLGKHTENTVCGILIQPDGYELETYDSKEDAENAGAQITHHGPCGLCSTTQDLAVYIREPDLTAPVRACGVKGLGKPQPEAEALARECLQDIGFSDPCIDIWYWDIENTKDQCMNICIKNGNLTKPHHNEDLSLNACVQCDEDESGPLFKVMSGRTRRNSGLSSALCRPCQTVQPVDHHYDWGD